MRPGLLVLFAMVMLVGAGCASRRAPPSKELRTADRYRARPAAALAYTPPAARALDPLETDDLHAVLARDGRGESAVLGYDLPTVMHLDVVVDDEQGRWHHAFGHSGWYDDYERRAISTRRFVRYR